MIDSQKNLATRVAHHLLVGAYLDSVVVYSSSVVLCFARLDENEKPDRVWVSSTGRILTPIPRGFTEQAGDEPDRRALAIYVLSQLIGEDVVLASILGAEVLSIWLEDVQVEIAPEAVNTEEVWSVTSDSPDPSFNHRWSVSLDDMGGVFVKHPSTFS